MGNAVKVALSLCLAVATLSGCAHGTLSEPLLEVTTSETVTSSPEIELEVSVEDIAIPSLKEYCSSTEAQIFKIDIDAYNADLAAFIQGESSWLDYYRTWELLVQGPALTAARRVANESPLAGAKNLEATSRAQFTEFVGLVLDSLLRECGLEKAYLERLQALKLGRIEIDLKDKEFSAASPPLNSDESGASWRAYGDGIEWRWGKECDRGFGSCMVIEVRTDYACDSIYVEANFSSAGAVTDSAIDSLRNLRPNQIGSFELVTTGSADSISLSNISCFG